MKYFIRLFSFCVIIFFVGPFFFGWVFSVSDEANLNLQVTGSCNNNGICESSLGESSLSCSADCGCNNDGICQSARGEDSLNCVLDCYSAPGGGGGSIAFFIQNIFVEEIRPISASVVWQTTRPAVCSLYFGETSEYEKETVSETQFKTNHSGKLADLQVSTIYRFKIFCRDAVGFSTETWDHSFSTLSILNNVSNLKILSGDAQLTLTWKNPSDLDFNKARILRSTNFYPTDPNQGEIVYEGSSNLFIDAGLINGTKYYYTVFTYNLGGDHSSSGAIVLGIPTAGSVVAPIVPPFTPPTGWKMSFGEFNFFVEKEEIIWFDETTIKIPVNKQILVSIYDRQLPPLAKTVVFSIKKDDESFSFLLSPDETKTLHEAAIPPTLVAGNYSITISIFNQKNELISEINGELRLSRVSPIFQFRWYYELPIYVILFLVAVILIIFGLEKEQEVFNIIRRRKNKEKEENTIK